MTKNPLFWSFATYARHGSGMQGWANPNLSRTTSTIPYLEWGVRSADSARLLCRKKNLGDRVLRDLVSPGCVAKWRRTIVSSSILCVHFAQAIEADIRFDGRLWTLYYIVGTWFAWPPSKVAPDS
jgi:hypothetical protein